MTMTPSEPQQGCTGRLHRFALGKSIDRLAREPQGMIFPEQHFSFNILVNYRAKQLVEDWSIEGNNGQ